MNQEIVTSLNSELLHMIYIQTKWQQGDDTRFGKDLNSS